MNSKRLNSSKLGCVHPQPKTANASRSLTASRYFSLLAALGFIAVAPAQSQPTAYVSGSGNDANPCTVSLPCRQISHALGVVSGGGEVIVSGSGDFQPFTVSRPASIVAAGGIYAGITSASGFAVQVSAGANQSVVLHGLEINGTFSPAATVYVAGGALALEQCDIRTDGTGVYIASGQVSITDTTITGEYSLAGANMGVFVYGPSSTADIERSVIEGSDSGVLVVMGGVAVVRDSTVIGDRNGAGVEASTGGSGPASTITVDNSTLTNNQTGAVAQVNSNVLISGSTITDNVTGVLAQSGHMLTRQNNTFFGNGADGTFTGSVAAK